MFWAEWAIALHRAVWFPMLWAVGLERPGVVLPEFAPVVADAPRLHLVKSERVTGMPTRRAAKNARGKLHTI